MYNIYFDADASIWPETFKFVADFKDKEAADLMDERDENGILVKPKPKWKGQDGDPCKSFKSLLTLFSLDSVKAPAALITLPVGSEEKLLKAFNRTLYSISGTVCNRFLHSIFFVHRNGILRIRLLF